MSDERRDGAVARASLSPLALVAVGVPLALGVAGCASSTACAPVPAALEMASRERLTPNVDAATAERDIASVLDDWHDAAAHADESRYFDHLTDDAVFLGTDATERWDKAAFLAYSHPHFVKGKAWTFRSTRRAVRVDAHAGLAWFDEDLDTIGLGPARGSGVLRFEDGVWRIVLYNLAITVPNERFDLAKLAAGDATILRPSDTSLASLGWLAGSWSGTTQEGALTEEHWTAPAGGVMVAVGRESKAASTTFFELMRIEERKDGVVLIAQPSGGKATEFRLLPSALADTFTFENRAHAFPQRISYARAGREAHVTIAGDGREETWALHRALAWPK